jgi:hypothetical protein
MVFEKKCNHLSLGDDKALKSRARIKRRCRDEEVLLHLFFKTISLRGPRIYDAGADQSPRHG